MILHVQLLDHFQVTCDDAPVAIPPRESTLISFLALHDRPIHRSMMAGTLWPNLSERRALGALRTALHRVEPPLVAIVGDHLALDRHVNTDLQHATELARNVLREADLPEPLAPILETLRRELLPYHDDVWIEPTRHRYRHLRLGALGAIARRLIAAEHLVEAVEAAQVALAVEPTSEMAEAALIEALVAEGNEAMAFQEFARFRIHLWRDLRLRPAHDFVELRSRALAIVSDHSRGNAAVTPP